MRRRRGTGLNFVIGRRNDSIVTVDHLRGIVTSGQMLVGAGAGANVAHGTYNLSGGATTSTLTNSGQASIGLGGSGGMFVSGGTWVVNHSIAIGGADAEADGLVEISGGSVHQAGTINRFFFIGDNGTLRVDGSAATLIRSSGSGTGGFAMTGNTATLEFVLDAGGVTPITVDNNLVLDGVLNVSLDGYTGTGPITLIDYGGTLSTVFDTVNLIGFTATLDYGDGTDDVVRLTDIIVASAVPEPASAGLLAVALAALARRRDRR